MTRADSDSVKQGDPIYAVGYPLGLAHTLSDGVISSRYTDENNLDILQITAAISPGSSGGALLNSLGEVVGVICASYVDGQNINIAIAANQIQSLLETSEDSIAMREFYALRSRIGINAFNLAQDFDLTQSGDFYFYVESQKIYCYNSETNRSQVIAEGRNINVYKGRLYYYNHDSRKIFSCAFDGTDKKEVLLNPNVINKTTSASDSLIAHGKLFFKAFNSNDYTSDLCIYDLDSGTQLDVIPDICNFSYYGDCLYIALSGRGIVELNMITFESQLWDTSCEPYIRGISDAGEIYYVDAYDLLENGYYWIDSATGMEYKNPNISREVGRGAFWDIWVAKDTVYLAMGAGNGSTKPFTYALYRIEENGSLQIINDSLMMHSGGYIPELNYYYVYDGTTVDMETGRVIGTWVFKR